MTKYHQILNLQFYIKIWHSASRWKNKTRHEQTNEGRGSGEHSSDGIGLCQPPRTGKQRNIASDNFKRTLAAETLDYGYENGPSLHVRFSFWHQWTPFFFLIQQCISLLSRVKSIQTAMP
jgi:hypothetical protein